VRYAVWVSPQAQREITEAAAYIAIDSPANAEMWLRKVEDAVARLADMPRRCPVARESPMGGREYRQLIVGSHRVLFAILQETVAVVHVRHGHRRDAGPEDVAF
jgi:plasmid stabilization system protein ParE